MWVDTWETATVGLMGRLLTGRYAMSEHHTIRAHGQCLAVRMGKLSRGYHPEGF